MSPCREFSNITRHDHPVEIYQLQSLQLIHHAESTATSCSIVKFQLLTNSARIKSPCRDNKSPHRYFGYTNKLPCSEISCKAFGHVKKSVCIYVDIYVVQLYVILLVLYIEWFPLLSITKGSTRIPFSISPLTTILKAAGKAVEKEIGHKGGQR